MIFHLLTESIMKDYIEDTESGIYRITPTGEIFSKSKLKIPIVGKGMEHTGKFNLLIKGERLLATNVNNRGYYQVVIRKRTRMVHRLVAEAFIPNPDNKPHVNHKDGDKLNNSVENLEWCTPKENINHAFETGLNKAGLGVKQSYKSDVTKSRSLANLKDKSKLTDDEVRYVRIVHKPRDKKYSSTALAKKYGTSVAAMCKIVNGTSYSHVR